MNPGGPHDPTALAVRLDTYRMMRSLSDTPVFLVSSPAVTERCRDIPVNAGHHVPGSCTQTALTLCLSAGCAPRHDGDSSSAAAFSIFGEEENVRVDSVPDATFVPFSSGDPTTPELILIRTCGPTPASLSWSWRSGPTAARRPPRRSWVSTAPKRSSARCPPSLQKAPPPASRPVSHLMDPDTVPSIATCSTPSSFFT